ncbi:pyridoxamine 5'-phosphate oxidase family protein [Magnetovibrio sp.]|uniref:pyridoxamine 5'-phosphate oxidase family protein n=1 Tax=Magnetovibrio sp. TaxID=2024836 RepID=UPI002F937B42
MVKPVSDIAFTPSVKAIQVRKGSRDAYRRMEQSGGWQTVITDDLAAFIADQRSFFIATVSSDGAPYIQHRGGPRGFLRVIGPSTLAFVDLKGNRQFITQGNLADTAKAHIFLIDYAQRQRIKIWGEARIVEDDAQLIEQLMPQDDQARAEQVVVFEISAWDVNCPQHIPVRFDAEDVERALAVRDARIAELEAELGYE